MDDTPSTLLQKRDELESVLQEAQEAFIRKERVYRTRLDAQEVRPTRPTRSSHGSGHGSC